MIRLRVHLCPRILRPLKGAEQRFEELLPVQSTTEVNRNWRRRILLEWFPLYFPRRCLMFHLLCSLMCRQHPSVGLYRLLYYWCFPSSTVNSDCWTCFFVALYNNDICLAEDDSVLCILEYIDWLFWIIKCQDLQMYRKNIFLCRVLELMWILRNTRNSGWATYYRTAE